MAISGYELSGLIEGILEIAEYLVFNEDHDEWEYQDPDIDPDEDGPYERFAERTDAIIAILKFQGKLNPKEAP